MVARGTEDIFNIVCVGLCTRVLYKVVASPWSATIAGIIGVHAVRALVTRKQALKRYVPI